MVTLQVAGRTEADTAVDWNRSLEFILGEGEVIQGQLFISVFFSLTSQNLVPIEPYFGTETSRHVINLVACLLLEKTDK